MNWNHRIVVTSTGEDPYCEVQEVYYNDDGSIAGYCDARLGSEYPEQIIFILQRMIDDIKRNPSPINPEDVVGFKSSDESHSEAPF